MTAQLQAAAGRHDKRVAGPIADTILAAPGRYDGQTAVAALAARAVISWDKGHVSEGLELFRDAARRGPETSPDARHVHHC